VSVTVRLYAGVKERAGVDALTLEIEGGDIRAVRAAVAGACPAIAEQLAYCRFAVDDDFVDDTTPVPDGSAVDVIPPVSGG